MIIIGTDEAGYGPNFGPLVVSASIWETPDENFSGLTNELNLHGISIGDSKKLYHGGGSLAPLEQGVLALLSGGKIDRNSVFDRHELERIPVSANGERTEESARIFETASRHHGIRFREVRSRSVFPEEFNRLLNRCDSKGALLSDITIGLVAEIVSVFPEDRYLFLCDKHGGRNRYLDLLAAFFPGEMIWIDRESRESSVYRFSVENNSVEFRFVAKGESNFPVAVASMISKYRRELAMIALNEFWREKIPGLRPTAGYPEDAKRFKKEIAAKQAELEIDDNAIWRRK